jgi:hypothetical protein
MRSTKVVDLVKVLQESLNRKSIAQAETEWRSDRRATIDFHFG